MNDSGWFTTDYDYSGPTEVVFEKPHAEFFGHAKVGPDDNGRPVIEVKVDRSNPPIASGFDLAEIQLGSHTFPAGGADMAVDVRDLFPCEAARERHRHKMRCLCHPRCSAGGFADLRYSSCPKIGNIVPVPVFPRTGLVAK
jgi:hypothetical protein